MVKNGIKRKKTWQNAKTYLKSLTAWFSWAVTQFYLTIFYNHKNHRFFDVFDVFCILKHSRICTILWCQNHKKHKITLREHFLVIHTHSHDNCKSDVYDWMWKTEPNKQNVINIKSSCNKFIKNCHTKSNNWQYHFFALFIIKITEKISWKQMQCLQT